MKSKNTRKQYAALILFFMLLQVFASRTFAQTSWGLKLGINASTQSDVGNLCDDTDLKAGLNAGVLVRHSFNNWLAAKSGIDYQLKGKKCDLPANAGQQTSRMHYAIVPFKAEFSAGEKAGFKNHQRLFFATGPYAAYLLKARQSTGGISSSLSHANNWDWGWCFELGMEFPAMDKHALQVSVNYDMGLQKTIPATKLYNKTASINLAVLF